jgi:hypothetical protein
MSRLASRCLPTLLTASLAAQAAPFPQNKLEFGNWYLQPGVEFFPNFRTAGGNLAGDGLFKVFPAEVLDRAGDLRISGYKITFEVDPAFTFTAAQIVSVPGVQFYRTRILTRNGQTFETIDLSQPVGPDYDPIQTIVPTPGPYAFEVPFRSNAPSTKLRQLLVVPAEVGGVRTGLAMLVKATVGERQGSALPGIALVSSFNERHVAPGRPTYSGMVTGGVVTHFGEPGGSSATGELAVGVRFADPVLQIFGSGARGVLPDPQGRETHLGPGAYANDLGSGGGFFGIYVQSRAHHAPGSAPTHWLFPLVVAQSLQGPTAAAPFGGAMIRYAPGQSDLAMLFVQAGVYGQLQTYRAGGSAGFDQDQEGVFASARATVAPSPQLVGLDLWLQGVVVGPVALPVANTQAVRVSFR